MSYSKTINDFQKHWPNIEVMKAPLINNFTPEGSTGYIEPGQDDYIYAVECPLRGFSKMNLGNGGLCTILEADIKASRNILRYVREWRTVFSVISTHDGQDWY